MTAGDHDHAADVLLDAEALASLGELVGDDPELIADLVNAFLEDAPARLTDLENGLAQADLVLAGRAAHTLKSNALTFGALELAGACRAVEELANGGELEQARAATERLGAEWQRARPAIAALAP